LGIFGSSLTCRGSQVSVGQVQEQPVARQGAVDNRTCDLAVSSHYFVKMGTNTMVCLVHFNFNFLVASNHCNRPPKRPSFEQSEH
jgi:hypothetical protein